MQFHHNVQYEKLEKKKARKYYGGEAKNEYI